ncbi:MAG TPA: DNA mismatch repair protein MutT [Erythrobacter sp.]|nr:DNA mismatch repair protein MutT [Erythrobacter sp.]
MENFPTWQLVVAGALQRDDGRWLMHRRPLGKHHAGLWEFPGGKVENGENPPLSLARELKEELGIVLDTADMKRAAFAHEPANSSGKPIVILLYIVRAWEGSPIPHEGGEIDWFEPSEIAQLAKPPLDLDLAAQVFPTECA